MARWRATVAASVMDQARTGSALGMDQQRAGDRAEERDALERLGERLGQREERRRRGRMEEVEVPHREPTEAEPPQDPGDRAARERHLVARLTEVRLEPVALE